ncbi:MAG TPA: macro domain-containing protein [Patescibacteria group bacterium]|nr:MAG: hypothetical protein UR43_C0005G0099 [candidate division TM6 bacterium GW2011_GWF2_33_332]HLD91068.1 macro domain-containing protein [Patescibacteria group bacterium]
MKIVNDSIFSYSATHTIVHCISLDCVMGKGIAKQIVDLNPNLRKLLLNGPFDLDIGRSYYIEDIHKVINMITKEFYYDKPTYLDFINALIDIRRIVEENDIKKIVMPKIGCGLDKLEWTKVKFLIEQILDDVVEELIVCDLSKWD